MTVPGPMDGFSRQDVALLVCIFTLGFVVGSYFFVLAKDSHQYLVLKLPFWANFSEFQKPLGI